MKNKQNKNTSENTKIYKEENQLLVIPPEKTSQAEGERVKGLECHAKKAVLTQ